MRFSGPVSHVIQLLHCGILVFGGSSLHAADDPTTKIAPLIARYCADCHMGGAEEGGLSLDAVRDFKDAKPDVWAAMHDQLQLGHMPPKDAEQPSADERAVVVGWIADSLMAAGHHVNDKLEWPNYGNYVPHEPLFRGPFHPAPATRIRLWRQRPDQYAARNGGGTQAFSLLAGQQIRDFASIYSVDEPAAEIVLRNAQQLVERWTDVELKNGAYVKGPGSQMPHPGLLKMVQPAEAPTAAQFETTIDWAFTWALNRRATSEELADIRRLYDSVAAEQGRLFAARAALAVPLLKAEAVYRVERGAGEVDTHGRRRLSKAEILAALRHTLTVQAEGVDGRPISSLLHAVDRDASAMLANRDDVAALVRQLLDAPLPSGKPNARLLDFFDEFFDFPKAKDVFKDIPRNTVFPIVGAVEDTRSLIAHVVAADRHVLRTLLTTDQAYAYHVHTRLSPHRLYGLPADWKKTDEPVTLRSDERAGVLTQPAWLVAHSTNFDNDPVRRGKWVLEHLLGGTVPDVPVTVCANVPPDETKTLRQRFEVIANDAYCWQCHRQMNPLGMAFEDYDHFGRYRLQELGNPVDASGAIVDSGVPGLDGPVTGAVALIQKIAGTERAQEMFVRYAFRFFLGRNETLRDAKTLRDANRAYEESGGSMKALVTALLSSDSFLYRIAAK